MLGQGSHGHGSPASAATTMAVEPSTRPDRAIKGPALASTSHAFQLIVMLTFNSILIFVALFLLPAQLLWRKATKYHELADDGGRSTMGALAHGAVVQSTENDDSAMRNMLTALKILFGALGSDTLTKTWIASAIYSALAPVALAQCWFVARFKGWFDEAEAMDRGDRDEVMNRRRIGMVKKMEGIALTSFALPIPIAIIYACIVLCGAPLLSNPLDTLILAAYIGVLAGLPAIALLESEESEWIKTFAQARQFVALRERQPRFTLLLSIVVCTLGGALIGSAGLLLDWDKAWQVYPVPPVLGAGIGAVVGNVMGSMSYFASVPLRRTRGGAPHVERPVATASASTSKKSNKKKR